MKPIFGKLWDKMDAMSARNTTAAVASAPSPEQACRLVGRRRDPLLSRSRSRKPFETGATESQVDVMLDAVVDASTLTHLEGGIPIAPHEHVAVLYRSRPAAFRLASFLAEGLQGGDLCIYLAPADYQAEMLERLWASGQNVGRHQQVGNLSLFRGIGTLRGLRDFTQQAFLEAERREVPAVRWLAEGLWPKVVGFPLPDFFEFDALLNYQVKHYRSVALCQYDLEQTEVRHLFSAIAVHRHLLVENTLVRDNPFYIPAEKFIPLSPEDRERDLRQLFREVGFDLDKLLAAIVGYGELQRPAPHEP